MPLEICITPRMEPELAERLKRRSDILDRLLDNPLGGPKPIGKTGELEEIGSLLWEASGVDVEALLEALDNARAEQDPVRITITGAPFQELTWELLYHAHPDIGFLGRHPWCVLARRIKGDGKKNPQATARPLRILLFIASPEDLDPERSRLDFEREEELLFTALDEPLSRGEIDIDVAEDGFLRTLVERLGKRRYHAVILSMHGAPARNAQGEEEWGLLFEDENTWQRAPVAGSDLAAALDRLPAGHRPGLVLLSACLSARAEESAVSIPSVARRLHENGFERVLGMRLSVLDDAASAFSAALFPLLACGEVLGRAVNLARDRVAEGGWMDGGSIRLRDCSVPGMVGDLFGQWSLPVLLDRTADGPEVDMTLKGEPIERPARSTVLIGGGDIQLPSGSSFIGRRTVIRRYLRPFLEGKTRTLAFTGPGGIGKTTLAGLFARCLRERQPNIRLIGFRAPFDLEALYEPLYAEAFDGGEEPALLHEIQTELDIRKRIRRMLVSLSRRKRTCAFVLDNLEAIQDLGTLQIPPEHESSRWILHVVCELPAPTRTLLTGRYALLRELHAADSDQCSVPEAPYGDVLCRMKRLHWPETMTTAEKRRVYEVLGGNHRAIEWVAQLLTGEKVKADELMCALRELHAPPETPKAVVSVVLEAMRENLLFSSLREQLTLEEDCLLRAASLYRVPVSIDGLLALDVHTGHHEPARERLCDYSLLETARDLGLNLDYYLVPPVVRELLKEHGFSTDELKRLHRAMGNYHRFQGEHVSRRLGDYVEAIYHFRQAGAHKEEGELAEWAAGYYYAKSNYADAARLVEEIVQRTDPLPPWWALNSYGACQWAMGSFEGALGILKRALSVARTEKEKGVTLNNISQIYQARGDYATALSFLEQSLEIRREIGDKAEMIPTVHTLASIALQTKDLQRALDLWFEALSIAVETGHAMGIFHVARHLGALLAQIGNQTEARKLLRLAVQAGKRAGFPGTAEVEKILMSLGPE